MISCWFLYIGVNKGCSGGSHKTRKPYKNLCNKKRTDDCMSTYVVFLKMFNRTNDFKYKNGTRVGQNLGANRNQELFNEHHDSSWRKDTSLRHLKSIHSFLYGTGLHLCFILLITYLWERPMRWWCRHDDTTTRQSHGHSMPMISEKDIYKQTHIKLCLIDRDKFADKALVKPGN